MGFDTTIDTLTGDLSFYDWFIKENNEIIAKLNLAQVSSITGGDGILTSLDPSSGLVTVSIGGTSGTIYSALTFDGDINFTGQVNVPNLSYKISGITSGTSGFTFGTVVRVTTEGYTCAIANAPDAAEVVGVLSQLTDTYSILTVSGKITGDFSDTESTGSVLSAGCVYFLDPTTQGKITASEPNTTGQVSKPVILGIDETSGIILPYRGNYLNSTSAGGESGINRIYISIDKSITDPSLYGFSAGTFVSFGPEVLAGNTFFNQVLEETGRTAISGWFLSGSKNYLNTIITDDPNQLFTSWEEDNVVGMIETVDTSNATYNIYQILIRGTSTIFPKSISEYSGSKQGSWVLSGTTYEINNAGITQQLVPHPLRTNQANKPVMQVGFVFDSSPTYWYVNPKPLTSLSISNSLNSASLSESFSGSENYSFNGDFSIWQRNTGKNSQYTGSDSVYFADNWIRRQSGIASGSSQYIERKQFSATSTEVEGYPEYYIDIKCVADPVGADPSGGVYSVGHVIDDIRSFNGSSVTVAFYAKCNASSYSANVYFARYSGGSLVSKTTIGTISLQTTWTKHVLNYEVSALTGGPFTDDYVEIGIDLIPLVEAAYDAMVALGTSLYVSISSFGVYEGNYSNPKINFEKYDNKLFKSQRYYYSTYKNNQLVGSKTMLNKTDPSLSTFSFNYLPTSPFGKIYFPNRMRSTPSVTVYSPYTGISNEMYNYTATRDLKNTSGTAGFNAQYRTAVLGSTTVSSVADETSARININAGAVPYDVINCHVIADASYPI